MFWRQFFLAVLALSVSSCASIFGNKRQLVEFNSKPQGAEVYLNGKYIGKTPVKYNIGVTRKTINQDNGNAPLWEGSHDITYVKDGFNVKEFNIKRSLDHFSTTHTKNK